MPRKPESSNKVKEIIWDMAGTSGTDNWSAFCRDVHKKLGELQDKGELSEDLPDDRKIRNIVELDIQRLHPEAVMAKLPRHVWPLRNDYESIKQLAESRKPNQFASHVTSKENQTSISQESTSIYLSLGSPKAILRFDKENRTISNLATLTVSVIGNAKANNCRGWLLLGDLKFPLHWVEGSSSVDIDPGSSALLEIAFAPCREVPSVSEVSRWWNGQGCWICEPHALKNPDVSLPSYLPPRDYNVWILVECDNMDETSGQFVIASPVSWGNLIFHRDSGF